MDKQLKTVFTIIFAFSFFVFGWLSHSSYKPPKEPEPLTLLQKIKNSKVLNVALLNSPSTYYVGNDGKQGFEYDLLNAYAKHIGVKLNITKANTIKEALKFSKLKHIHITSAAFAKTKQREKDFNFGPSYFEVQQQVVCSRSMVNKGTFPRSIEDLKGLSIKVGEGTNYSDTLKNLKKEGYEINATLNSSLSTEELLAEVASHKIECTLADSNVFALNQRYFPSIAKAFDISKREQLAWILAPNSDKLESDMYAWLNGFNQSGQLLRLKDHYYSYSVFFDFYDNKMFYKRVKSRLPKYKKYFVKYGKKYEIPWTLLAAQSYQESHWNPKAKSFTGVRGLMMLTRRTAKLLGIKNRLSANQSIRGGTRHLNQMIRNMSRDVKGDDRLKFALAAYNIGMGHIKDAQKLAKKMGLNENVWSDLKKALPLLSQKKYYKTLRYGYARGSEPVRYVDSIYDFRKILENIVDESSKTTSLDDS